METATDVAARLFLAAFGIVWFMLASLNIEIGQRDLTWSSREWLYVATSILAVPLVILGCLPTRLLANGVVRWSFLPAILIVEFVIALAIHRNLYHRQAGFVALVAALLGVLVALGAARLLRARAKRPA
jgi:hypothetical protein